jgi:hypothetical protein
MLMTTNSTLEPADIRRENLKIWLANHEVPQKEKSYFSQLKSGSASFGEKAARRLEVKYNMGTGYLDKPLPEKNGKAKDHLGDLLTSDPQKGIEDVLLNCFRACSEDDRDLLLSIANKLYERARPNDAVANPKNRRKTDVKILSEKAESKNT